MSKEKLVNVELQQDINYLGSQIPATVKNIKTVVALPENFAAPLIENGRVVKTDRKPTISDIGSGSESKD